MEQGKLSEYFEGVAAKRLSAVEANPKASHQHEFNGVTNLREIFGEEKRSFSANFFYFSEDSEVPAQSSGQVTWYDARERHDTRTEFRLYFSSSDVTGLFIEGDLLIVGKKTDGKVFIIAAQKSSTVERQLIWLFGLSERDIADLEFKKMIKDDRKLDFAANYILQELGLDTVKPANDLLEEMIEKFGGILPKTKVFSAYAREKSRYISPKVAPDEALLAWIQKEEELFRAMEKYIVGGQVKQGFGGDVDAFISFSLSVQNRRKSRVGFALENHLEFIFSEVGISFDRNKATEKKKKPDFLFPGFKQYHDRAFPSNKLFMLGSKSTCKDRWRQVLSEAARIKRKHLLTLEPGISDDQTEEMEDSQLQLVVPYALHQTYSPKQQKWLMSLEDFVNLAKSK